MKTFVTGIAVLAAAVTLTACGSNGAANNAAAADETTLNTLSLNESGGDDLVAENDTALANDVLPANDAGLAGNETAPGNGL